MKPTVENFDCYKEGVLKAIDQAGGDITKGFIGGLDTNFRVPIDVPYYQTSLCPVNVHWHLGAEHRSEGEFDEDGKSPDNHLIPEDEDPEDTRRLAAARYGFACKHYDSDDARFNTEYPWKYCRDMHVGETYEVH